MQHVYSYLYYIYTYYITISCFDWSMFVRVYIYICQLFAGPGAGVPFKAKDI